MRTLSYTKKVSIKKSVSDFEEIYKDIITFPLHPRIIAQLRWNGIQKRIYYNLRPLMQQVSLNSIAQIISLKRMPHSMVEKQILCLKETYDYVYDEWLCKKTLPEEIHIQNISEKIFGKKNSELLPISSLLSYTLQGNDEPIVKASLIYIHLRINSQDLPLAHIVAQYTTHLILFSFGYDFREMIVFDEWFYLNKNEISQQIQVAIKQNSATEWIEYFVTSYADLAKKQFNKIQDEIKNIDVITSTQLTDRQRAILTFISNPEKRISNRDVQKLFHVSQITASRDLTSLAEKGLVLIIGKGRSTYYSKI
ncbi:MAG: hypothetical protein WCO06_03660 [Candidatus Roizmanbacteria bacterium]